jgi:hypothetical protein
MLDLHLKRKQGPMTPILDMVIIHTLKELLNVVSMIFFFNKKLETRLEPEMMSLITFRIINFKITILKFEHDPKNRWVLIFENSP